MAKSIQTRLDKFMKGLKPRNPGEDEFHQAVYEVSVDIIPFIYENPIYQGEMILEPLTEPDLIIIFRVGWEDNRGNVRANREYHVQHSKRVRALQ